MRHFKTISEFHEYRGLPHPNHPLFSVIDISTPMQMQEEEPVNMTMDFYSIAVKRMSNVKVKYGQQYLDFNEGVMSFMAPRQVFSISINDETIETQRSGWVIYIHPDFLWNTPLAKVIKQYDFWDYSLREALFLSAKEETTIYNIIENIIQEYYNNIDKFSKKIIIAQIESLLTYAERFYNRQFITREKTNHQLVGKLAELLDQYFNTHELIAKGLPTVQYIADQLHLSPKYLSTLLSTVTGQSTQQHIHEKLIEVAKEKLSTTSFSVAEVAYQLGFEHAQSFNRLFKTKTNLSPLEFRASFNTN
ncbi:helix-turn-helix domain-containing protein [Chitinophaga oryziterrae]|uniref:Helix-turn-helix domain-containing protein n=1 Tax=Chitinophaga oryziterrae TaxID=1031224 RepID=A0A6N8J8I9_9BACT|nr:helix-turn-helix domain-containing protein [Chitinophaga oryziterrae]MVT41595.1 helix-turn-helix domain-containing protein [Chitinophaga oryziterrae]